MNARNGDAALGALRRTDFNWVTRLDDVWSASAFESAPLHEEVFHELVGDLGLLAESARGESAAAGLGRVITGTGGSGKTHLLGRIRRETTHRGGFFIQVDCTDIREFWPTVLLSLVKSMHREFSPGWSQFEILRWHLTRGCFENDAACMNSFGAQSPDQYRPLAEHIIARSSSLFAWAESHSVAHLASLLRALLLVTSKSADLCDRGNVWIEGVPLDAPELHDLGLQSAPALMELLRAFSSLVCQIGSFLVFTFDQLDALISQQHLAGGAGGGALTDEQMKSRSIIEGLGGGLMALYDNTFRSVTIVSSLPESWEILIRNIVGPAAARFVLPPLQLSAQSGPEATRTLIRSRLALAYEKAGWKPPFDIFPFDDAFIAEVSLLTPRQVLQRCDRHRRQCVARGEVFSPHAEPAPLPPESKDPSAELEAILKREKKLDEAQNLLREESEDDLGNKLREGLGLLRYELPLPDDIHFVVDANFRGGKSYPTWFGWKLKR